MNETNDMTEQDAAQMDAQIRRRIAEQLDRPLSMLLGIRLTGLAVIGSVSVWALVEIGQAAAAVVAGLVFLALFVLGATRRKAQAEALLAHPERLSLTFLTVIAMQTLAIALTGGLHSPIIIVYMPAMILGTVMAGEARVIAPALGLMIAGISMFAVIDWFAPDMLLRLSDQASRYLLGGFIVLASLVGAVAALVVRGAFERSVRAEVGLRAASVDALRARNSELKELGSSLAHELKNPLAAIQGLTMQQLRHAPEGSRDAERLAVVVGEVKRMSRVLEDFLSFSRPFSDVEKEPVDLRKLAESVVELHRDHVEGLGVELRLVGDSLTVPCDARQIDHVLVNLLLNAIEVSPRDATIEVRVGTTSDVAYVEVLDEGPGLSDVAAERAFDVGFTTRSDGTGLGLAISRGIANAHGGALTLQNRGDGGCVARMEIPLEEA